MAKIEVKCGNRGNKLYMEDNEKKSCPKCSFVITGPKGNSFEPCIV